MVGKCIFQDSGFCKYEINTLKKFVKNEVAEIDIDTKDTCNPAKVYIFVTSAVLDQGRMLKKRNIMEFSPIR